MIKQQRINAVTEGNYKLMRQLADAIHSFDDEDSKDANYVPDVAMRQSKHKENPIEICLVYLREKIAQSQGLVDAIDQRQKYVDSYMLKVAVRDTKKRNISQRQQAGLNQIELNNAFRQVAEIEEAMRLDQTHVNDMNRRIIDDF